MDLAADQSMPSCILQSTMQLADSAVPPPSPERAWSTAVGACSRVDVGVTGVGSNVNRIGAVNNVSYLQLNQRNTEGDIYRRWRAVGASGPGQRQVRRAKNCTMNTAAGCSTQLVCSRVYYQVLIPAPACRLNSPKHLHVDVQRVTPGGVHERERQRRLAV